jgi:hypothetical protein
MPPEMADKQSVSRKGAKAQRPKPQREATQPPKELRFGFLCVFSCVFASFLCAPVSLRFCAFA